MIIEQSRDITITLTEKELNMIRHACSEYTILIQNASSDTPTDNDMIEESCQYEILCQSLNIPGYEFS